jgi:hypothetical protein
MIRLSAKFPAKHLISMDKKTVGGTLQSHQGKAEMNQQLTPFSVMAYPYTKDEPRHDSDESSDSHRASLSRTVSEPLSRNRLKRRFPRVFGLFGDKMCRS